MQPPASLKALDIAAVFLIGIDRALFLRPLRLGNGAKLLLELGRFLDLFLASFPLSALLGVGKMLGFKAGPLGRFLFRLALRLSGGGGFLASFQLGLALFLALGSDRLNTRATLGLVIDRRFGRDRGLGLEFFQ